MKISRSVFPSPANLEKVEKYESIFEDAMTDFFKTKNYGRSINQVIYLEWLMPMRENKDDPPKIIYNDKTIRCIIKPSYRKTVIISINNYGSFMAKQYLEMSNKFRELSIKGFNANAYVKDLEDFFKKAGLFKV